MRRLVFSRTHTLATITAATHLLPHKDIQDLPALLKPLCCPPSPAPQRAATAPTRGWNAPSIARWATPLCLSISTASSSSSLSTSSPGQRPLSVLLSYPSRLLVASRQWPPFLRSLQSLLVTQHPKVHLKTVTSHLTLAEPLCPKWADLLSLPFQ